MAEQHKTQLIEQSEVAEATMRFTFAKPEGFEYEAGQFISLELPSNREKEGRKKSHTFTLASAPHEENLTIATRMRDTVYKESLEDLSAGSEVNLKGPNGSLTWPDDSKASVVFIAGGIGITPFLSMMRDTHREKREGRVTLFYSNRRPEDAAFLDELQDLARSTKDCRVVNTMTSMEDSKTPWEGERGHIDEDMLKRYVSDLNSPIYYVAGPPDMVSAMDEMLQKAGIDKTSIKTEQFSGY